MKNVIQKRVALQRAMRLMDDYMGRVKEEFGRDSPAYESLDTDLKHLHDLRRDLEQLSEQRRGE